MGNEMRLGPLMTFDIWLSNKKRMVNSERERLAGELSSFKRSSDWGVNGWVRNKRLHQKEVRAVKNALRFLVMVEEGELDAYFPLLSRKYFCEMQDKVLSQAAKFGLYDYNRFNSVKRMVDRDGELFSFFPVDIKVCGCGKYPGLDSDVWEEEEVIEAADKHLPECPSKKTETVDMGVLHTVGNWDCKGCLLNENGEGKQIEFCPRFLRGLRREECLSYLEMVKGNNSCYAGLLHSQVTVGEKEVSVQKKCDSCGYFVEDKKELAEQESVQEGDILFKAD